MEKPFFEVFHTLLLEESLKACLDRARVTKVSLTSRQDLLRVYLESDRLIQKEKIMAVEREIRRQLFRRKKIQVKIMETYHLSRQYTPLELMKAYRGSILCELKEYSVLDYHIFRRARWEFKEEELFLTLDNSLICRERSEGLVQILYKIFGDRCGLPIRIHTEFAELPKPEAEDWSHLGSYREAAAVLHASGDDEGAMAAEGQQEPGGGVSLKADGLQHPESSGAINEDRPRRESAYHGSMKGSMIQPETMGEAEGALKVAALARTTKGSNDRVTQRGKKQVSPETIFGRDFEGEELEICKIVEEMGEVVIRGQILNLEDRPIRNERSIILFSVTDFTDSISVKIFARTEEVPQLTEQLKVGAFVKLKGMTVIDRFDRELSIGSVVGIRTVPDFTVKRTDQAPHKRVELHCHTRMSDMDGVSDVKDIIRRAAQWGHKAIAITDHGVVQAFPDANHVVEDPAFIEKYGEDFKVIYGVEAYLVDDLQDIVTNPQGQGLNGTFVVFDLETTGFHPERDKIIEIGAVKIAEGQEVERFSAFVNPGVPIPFEIEQLTGIRDEMVQDAPPIEEVLPRFLEFCKDAVMVAHNARFDMSFLEKKSEEQGLSREFTSIDTVGLARYLLPDLNRFKLDTVAKALKIPLESHHRAVDDAGCTAGIFLKFLEMLGQKDIHTLEALREKGKLSQEAVKKLKSYHATILAKNDVGRVNLYRLVSFSHIDYFYKRPLVPKSLYLKYQEGLMIGSACEAGELYQAILGEKPEEEIVKIADFYDYLEIQPLMNNGFMINSEKSRVSSMEDLMEINRKIVRLGEDLGKPVVAACDVHFLDPEDEVYRRIIMAGKGFADADDQAPLYLRTTEEMLEEFSYLGGDKAREVVIENTNYIAGLCEKISPVRPDKCPPVIPDSDKELRRICYQKAYEMYGSELPPVVTERLERELNSIISNGFAVMYIIAQKLVWKSNEDGYLVGSRGSVGSSFVATMAGITEVNPLSPHYYCPGCHYSDFDSKEVRAYATMSGCDMPDMACPVCGEQLKKDGFDIPFETFLGFKGNKEPDIDLNFSGDYQSSAHRYTEVIFGKGHTFRAGTIGTLADKTAFGYVKNYYEERGVPKRKCEISRIVKGCVGVRRTTGQHPGGIVVLPHNEEIYSFTPVQHPANDMSTDIITTHFDYHSIDHNLLKLDILGHDDPTMIRMLEDLTGLDAKSIPLDDKTVMSLFRGTEVLGITPEDIGGCPLGCLGIPEFGTDFVIQMLVDTKPETFSDLVRISGLSHGTDVWLGNAQTLIQEKKATISTAICTRDDIMTYLINQGLESELSFKIMESVRKGNGLKPEWEEAMLEHNVPDWYIWSCKKIQYMFPKAHAAAYVMMAWRIAYCKVFHPLAYYAAFFSIRASAFDYALMCQGREKLEYYIEDYRKRSDALTQKEQASLRDMRIVQEMFARGFEFLPLDIYQAKAHRFQIIDGKLMPSFDTIDGMGERAVELFEEEAKKGKFLSKDDLRERVKISKSTVDTLAELGLLKDLPESNQLSLFD